MNDIDMRQYFAGLAMKVYLESTCYQFKNAKGLAVSAYAMADAMVETSLATRKAKLLEQLDAHPPIIFSGEHNPNYPVYFHVQYDADGTSISCVFEVDPSEATEEQMRHLAECKRRSIKVDNADYGTTKYRSVEIVRITYPYQFGI